MAEVHLIGHLLEASGFDDKSLFAKWSLKTASNWTVLEGLKEGQTHLSNAFADSTQDSGQDGLDCNRHIWSHPIDVHYVTKGLSGWPKFEFQIWTVDWMGKANISSYGYLSIPMHPGYHELTCYTWRPVGDIRRRIVDYMTGYRMHLVDPSDPIINGFQRHAIQAQSMGTITVELNLVFKDFDNYGLDI